MFILRFLRYLRGYVQFEARGAFVERFLNLVARDKIPVWGGRKKGDVYTGYVAAKSYSRLRGHAKQAGVRIHLVDKEGAPFQRRKYRKRMGLLVGLGTFAVFLLFMSGFIWRVEVVGNEVISESRIIGVLEEIGISPGTLRSSIDVRDAERRLALALQDASWVALNIDGSVVRVVVSESTLPPEMVDPQKPCNIVASRTGRIVDLRVYDGQAMVMEGDTVLEGDVVVSGVMQDRLGQNRLKHALADVVAEVQHTVTLEVPLNQVRYRETGSTKTRNYLDLFAFELPLFWPGSMPQPYRVERASGPFQLFSLELPLGYLREEYILMEEYPVTLTEEEAKQQALEELANLEAVEFGDGEIVSRTMTGILEGDMFYLRAEYIANVNIGRELEILYTTEN